MSFDVGQLVVCVGDGFKMTVPPWNNKPRAGCVYTIRFFEMCENGGGLLLEEVVNDKGWCTATNGNPLYREPTFHESAFMPVKKPDIEPLREMLNIGELNEQH